MPVVFGQTQNTAGRKEPTKGERWSEEKLIEAFTAKFPDPEVAVARAILDWMKHSGFPLAYGTGVANGSVYPLYKPSGVAINPAYLSTDGKIWLQFKSLEGKPVFGGWDQRKKLISFFAQIEGAGLRDASADKWANIPLSVIAKDPRGTEKVLAGLQWIADQVRADFSSGSAS